jgi:dephospho-CoA kinase
LSFQFGFLPHINCLREYNSPDVFAGKPIIGIVGGIGSGKSFVARMFGEEGCLVIDSDEAVGEAYRRPEVREKLREWWGGEVFLPNGQVNRKEIARRVFGEAGGQEQRKRLEGLVHPIVAEIRDEKMREVSSDSSVAAYVWDTPLLLETGLGQQCDAIVFVDAPWEQRLERVKRTRGWDEGELARREKLQMPLDKKRVMANDMVRNTAGADEEVRNQVRKVLSRILAGITRS